MNNQSPILCKKYVQNSFKQSLSLSKITRSFSFTSGKGGVGKTNIVINLAIQLARKGKKVFIIDADLGLANIDIMLNIAPEYTIEDVLMGKKHIKDVIMEGPLGISILPASSGISDMQSLSGQQQMLMLKALSSLKMHYDYLLIDTGAGIASNVLRFNAAADEICVVTNPEPTAITDAYALMKIMSIQYQVNSFNLIVNQSAPAEAWDVFNRLVNVLNRFLSVKLELIGSIPRDPNFIKAVKKQTPLSILVPTSSTSKSFEKIAFQIDSINGESTPEEQKSSFWNKLGNWKQI